MSSLGGRGFNCFWLVSLKNVKAFVGYTICERNGEVNFIAISRNAVSEINEIELHDSYLVNMTRFFICKTLAGLQER